MDVTQTQSPLNSAASGTAANAASANGKAEAAEKGGSALSSDFETFLRMLTVQMENQDPLNPMQSSDFAVQLATFSGVEQQVRTNELLQGLASDKALGALGSVAGWVGQEARAAVPAQFDGQPVTVHAKVPSDADQATLVVRDSNGRTISRVAVSPDQDQFVWDGTDAKGAAALPGAYSFFVEPARDGDAMSLVEGEVYGRVVEARLENGDPVVVFASGAHANPGEVSGLRAPQ